MHASPLVRRLGAATFVAIDFETANRAANSACAIGLARVERGRVVARHVQRLRPPRLAFTFTHVHGIRARDVLRAPTFAAAWPAIARFVAGAEALVAHNAPFDARVLGACCAHYDLEPVALPFVCTLRLARAAFALPRNRLCDVAAHLGLALDHHEAGSDAEVSALVALEAARRLR